MKVSALATLGLAILIAGSSSARAAGTRPAEYTTDQVLDGISRLNDRLRRWSIEIQAAARGLPYYTHRTFTARHPDSCRWEGAKSALTFDVDGDEIGVDWRENDPFQDWLLVTPGRLMQGEPMNRLMQETPLASDAAFPGKIQNELLFLAFGWWPFEGRPEPQFRDGGSLVIPGIVRSGLYSVAPEQVERGGHWCHVLERPGRDRLWIAPELGFATIAREVTRADSGVIIQRIEMSDFRPAGEGVWAPRELRNLAFDHEAATADGRMHPVMDSRLRILRVAINDAVDDRLLEPHPLQPGTLRILPDGGYYQETPGGADHIDKVARHLVKIARVGVDSSAEPGGAMTYWLLAASAVAIAALTPWQTANSVSTLGSTSRRRPRT